MGRNKFGCRYCKIVFTGAPGSGKTTALEQIAKCLDSAYSDKWRIFKVIEVASFLYQGRVQRAEMNERRINQWQEDIVRTIIQLETVYEHIAEFEEERNVLILCDRGCMDPKVFTQPKEWENFLQKIEIDENALVARYDCVLQLFTAPKVFYAQESNPHRRESHAESAATNARYTDAWSAHPRFIPIHNTISDEKDLDNLEIGLKNSDTSSNNEHSNGKNREDLRAKQREAWSRKLEEILRHVQQIMDEEEEIRQREIRDK